MVQIERPRPIVGIALIGRQRLIWRWLVYLPIGDGLVTAARERLGFCARTERAEKDENKKRRRGENNPYERNKIETMIEMIRRTSRCRNRDRRADMRIVTVVAVVWSTPHAGRTRGKDDTMRV